MPLEYIYTFAQRNHNSSGGSGFVVWPPKELRAEKAARQIVEATGVDDYQLGDHPFYAFTKYNHTYSLTRTFTTPHYSTKQPVRFSHIMILDPRERAYLSEGPIYALRHFRFQTEYGQSGRWPCEQSAFQPLPKKEPQPLPQCKTWQALTGDAGWCGWCAEQVMEGKTLFWVYDPEKTNGSEVLLDLLDELIQLLPAERRWSVTFNTRVDLPSQIAQQILCFEERKESVISQIRLPRGRKSETIPLHRLSEIPCPDTDWVNYARTGQMTITNYETGVMVLNSDQYTYQELIEKFEKNYIQAEELDQAADELGTTENLIEDWEKRIHERCEELEERRKYVESISSTIVECLGTRRDILANRNRELGQREEKIRRNESCMRGKLENIRTKLEGILDSMADRVGELRESFDAKIRRIREKIERDAEQPYQQLAGYYDQITREAKRLLKQLGEQKAGVENNWREVVSSERDNLDRIRQDITGEYSKLRTAGDELEKCQKELGDCRKRLESAWEDLCKKANACRSAITGTLEPKQQASTPKKPQQASSTGTPPQSNKSGKGPQTGIPGKPQQANIAGSHQQTVSSEKQQPGIQGKIQQPASFDKRRLQQPSSGNQRSGQRTEETYIQNINNQNDIH